MYPHLAQQLKRKETKANVKKEKKSCFSFLD
jgi:hypothetical protein